MNDISKAWDWEKTDEDIWFRPSEDSYYLLERWRGKGYRNFLDLGCGRGRHSLQFARHGFTVKSLDLSEYAVNELKEAAKMEDLDIIPAVGDMNSLPYPDGSIDCLLAYHVISHTDSKGIIKILSEIDRVLADDSEFYITFCSKNTWSFKEAGYPKLDENTVVKREDGPEDGIPHFYVDDTSIRKLLGGFDIISLRHVQDIILEGHDHVSWHYFVLGRKRQVK